MAKTVMIVDDEVDIRESVKTVLTQEGYKVETAENGADFLEKMKESKPDLVLLDIMMPGLSTSDILQSLTDQSVKAKVMFMTVVRLSDKEVKNLTKLGNVVDYITKPFDVGELTKRVKKATS